MYSKFIETQYLIKNKIIIYNNFIYKEKTVFEWFLLLLLIVMLIFLVWHYLIIYQDLGEWLLLHFWDFVQIQNAKNKRDIQRGWCLSTKSLHQRKQDCQKFKKFLSSIKYKGQEIELFRYLMMKYKAFWSCHKQNVTWTL